VADHAPPIGHLDALAADLDLAVEDRVRIGAEELGLRQLRAIEKVAWQMVEGLMAVGEAQVPLRLQHVGGDAPDGPAVGHRRVRHADVGVRRRAQLVGAELPLGRARTGGGRIEEHEPDGTGRFLARPLVDGVADPGGPPATGLDELQVEALVVAGLGGNLRETCLGSHARDAIGR